MRRTRRLARLAVRMLGASPTRAAVMVLLLAVSILVFLAVSELSNASSDGLDEAVLADVGQSGTYTISVEPMGLSTAELTRTVAPRLAKFTQRTVVRIDRYRSMPIECPPLQAIGTIDVSFVSDMIDPSAGSTASRDHPFDYGKSLPVDTQLCLDGLVIPGEGIYPPSGDEQSLYGIGLYVTSEYEPLVRAIAPDPTEVTFVIITGHDNDVRDLIESDVQAALREPALRAGTTSSIDVRYERDGADVRRASQGVRVVYGVIGWSVLALGALGLMIVELIVVRGRTWFFGLARATGGRRGDVAALVLIDATIIVVLGFVVALVAAALLQPTADRFSRQSFGVGVDLVRPSSVFTVLIGSLGVLLIATVVPVITAVRNDPLDALEPRS